MSFDQTDSRTVLKKRTLTVTLSLGRLLTAIIALFFGALWFFLIGLLVGRGYYPESITPSLAQLMPQPQTNNRVLTVIADAPHAEATPQAQTPPPQIATPAPQNTPIPQATKPAPKPVPKEETFDYAYQVASFKDNTSATELVKKLQTAKLKARVTKAQSTTTTTVWYRVVVDFRGTPTDTDALKVSLKKLNLADSLMLSKKTVAKP